jgi:hypothetical protein
MTLGLGIGLKLIFTVYDIGLILIHDIDLILIWYWSGIDLLLIWYWSGIDPGIGLILILILIWYWLDIEKWINPQDWKNQLLRLKKINFNIIDQDWSGLIFFNPGSSGHPVDCVMHQIFLRPIFILIYSTYNICNNASGIHAWDGRKRLIRSENTRSKMLRIGPQQNWHFGCMVHDVFFCELRLRSPKHRGSVMGSGHGMLQTAT